MSIYENDLSERKKFILKAIIDVHIDVGEPVGSKYLSHNQQLNCSSATIRNEMAELEEMGYLEQPHTSAGRVPSELGYRFYVDSLLHSYSMTAGELDEINRLLRVKMSEIDKIIEQASRLASVMTNYTGLAVKPRPSKITFLRFEIIYLDSRNFILVMLTSENIIKTKHIHLNFDIMLQDSVLLCTVLNDCIANLTADDITLPLIVDMELRMGARANLIDPLVKCIYRTMNELDGGEIKVKGVNRLLRYPEYSDVNRLRSVLELIEQKEELLNIISGAKQDTVNVCIGSESSVEIMSNSALVFKTVKNGERVIGAIGVLGPCRMDYARAIAMIDRLATGVCDMINDDGV